MVLYSFEKFHLEPHSRCDFDAVSIYNGEVIDSSQLIGRYCGTTIPPDVVSSGSSIVVNFATDSSRTGEGFFAQYRSVYGKLLSASGGLFVGCTGSGPVYFLVVGYRPYSRP